MIRIKPYRASDVDTILSWCQDEKSFYQWTAGIRNMPLKRKILFHYLDLTLY